MKCGKCLDLMPWVHSLYPLLGRFQLLVPTDDHAHHVVALRHHHLPYPMQDVRWTRTANLPGCWKGSPGEKTRFQAILSSYGKQRKFKCRRGFKTDAHLRSSPGYYHRATPPKQEILPEDPVAPQQLRAWLGRAHRSNAPLVRSAP